MKLIFLLLVAINFAAFQAQAVCKDKMGKVPGTNLQFRISISNKIQDTLKPELIQILKSTSYDVIEVSLQTQKAAGADTVLDLLKSTQINVLQKIYLGNSHAVVIEVRKADLAALVEIIKNKEIETAKLASEQEGYYNFNIGQVAQRIQQNTKMNDTLKANLPKLWQPIPMVHRPEPAVPNVLINLSPNVDKKRILTFVERNKFDIVIMHGRGKTLRFRIKTYHQIKALLNLVESADVLSAEGGDGPFPPNKKQN